MSDDEFTLDFSSVKATSFEAVPNGWYLCVITDAGDSNPTKGGPTAKLPEGTPGTNWEFTVDEGKFDNRRFWTNHWHHESTLGFMKTLLIQSGAYTEEELTEGGINILEARDKAVGKAVWVRVKVRKATDDYDESNDVKGFRSINNPPKNAGGSEAKPSTSIMP